MKKTTCVLFWFLNFFYNCFYANAIILNGRDEWVYICAPGEISPYDFLYINYFYIVVIFIVLFLFFKWLHFLFNKKKNNKEWFKYVFYSLFLLIWFYILIEHLVVPIFTPILNW